ncbi:MAG: isoaspartyl peptidase/L-asparaginase [Staphylothermus sp.]|nr:isoaspartyl peptidase/L-asparaginase [Staphylothermus sp.]
MVKALILHGGAGSWRASKVKEKALETMKKCTAEAWTELIKKGSAIEAVVYAVKCMEDSGYLNAGVGSVPDILGNRTLDAGIMTSNGLLGAVAGVTRTKNPIILARIVAEETPHIIIGGYGADELAVAKKLPLLPPPPKHVIERYYEGLQKLFKGEIKSEFWKGIWRFIENNKDYLEAVKEIMDVSDTVGAVAVDDNGVLAAAVSTGGVIFKLPGRIGDSPIPGAGFYADENVACSATGFGERIIETMPCRMLSELVRQSMKFKDAINEVIKHANELVGTNTMGFIAVSKDGEIGWAYNTEAMLIGYVSREGEIVTDFKP